jgi:hypothetical protein
MHLAALRVVRRPARAVIVAIGVALATATLVGVSSGSLIMRDRTLRAAVAALDPAQRSFRVDEFGLAFSSSPAARRVATTALALVTPRIPVRTVAFRALRFETHLVRLTAVDGITHWLGLRSGRSPRVCRPTRCEVLIVGPGRLPPILTAPGLRLIPVGRASLTVPSVFGDFARPSDATLLVSSDVQGVSSLPALQSDFRTESWVVPLNPRDIRIWDVDRVLAREAHAQSLLERADPAFALTAPDDALLNGRRQGVVGSRRLLLVGGEVAALLLGFAGLAAIGLRRSLLAEWERLEGRGARRSQLWILLVSETGASALAGAVVGGVVGAGVAIWASARAGSGGAAILFHGVLTLETAAIVGLAWAVATAVVALAVRSPSGGRGGPVRVGDVVALGALAAAVVAASRGGAGADALAGNRGSVTLLLLFPGLVCLGAAVLAARLLAPLLRLAERIARRGRPSVRLALLALARAPSRTAVAVAFFVGSLGFFLLAASYRATLERGIRDEAAYQVPLDYTLTEGTQLVGPLDAAPIERYRLFAPGVEAYPVLRRYGDVPSIGTAFTSPVVLGLDPRAVARVHGWRSDFGRVPPHRLAGLLGAEGTVRLAGAPVPRGTTGLGLAAELRGAGVTLAVVIARPSGAIVRVPLSRPGLPGTGRGPPVPSDGRVVALEFSLTQVAAAEIAHSEGEGLLNAGVEGTLHLGPLIAFAGGRRLGIVTSWHGWVGRSGAKRLPGDLVRVHYALTAAQSALLRPKEPTDGHPLPIVVSPDIARVAAPDGLVTFQFGTQQINGKIVAVADRFPATADGGGSFAIADESHLQTALDADAPGTGRPIETWLSVPSRSADSRVEAALRRSPFSALDVASRRGLEGQLRSDPLSRSIEIALLAGALIALALAVCGLWLIVHGDAEDERGELYDLEAQGATPGDLRRQLRLRAAILGALGVAGGLVLGLILSSEVVRLVQVSASGAVPVPPLVREVGWGSAGLGLGVLGLLGAALVETTVRRAFHQRTARPS